MTVTLLLIFATVFLGTFPLTSVLRRVRHSHQLRRRVRQMGASVPGSPTESSEFGLMREADFAEHLLSRLPITRTIKKQVELSGVGLTTLRFLLLTGAVSTSGFVACFAWKQSLMAALLVALALAALPFAYLVNRKKRRHALFVEQLPDALMMIARSLRAGHSLASAVELVSLEQQEPVSGLFKLAYEQQKLGVRIVDCLISLRAKIDSEDFNFFLTIVRINTESGGNLSEILDKLADTIRSRLQIRRQVEVLTAEGRISGYILTALPVVMFGVFYLLRPGYLDVFFTERICQLILGAAVLGQIVGYFIIRKIVNISI